MEQHYKDAIEWIKSAKINNRPIEGVLTGSCLLEIFKDDEHTQDIDIFVYSPEEFINFVWLLHYDKNFLILDSKEQWKFDKFTSETRWETSHKSGVNTIKFMWNQVIPINVIFKTGKKDIFGVLSAFDMDIVSRGYDLKTGSMLDLSAPGSIESRIASPNIWNKQFEQVSIWSVGKLLRQAERCIKYYERGYNTDPMINKYIELIGKIEKEQNIFDSPKYGKVLKQAKTNFKLVKGVFNQWLKVHKITEEELTLLRTQIKEF